MPISHENKTILVHIPKTAGESMERKLGMYGLRDNPLENLWGTYDKYILQHLTISQMKRYFLTDAVFNEYFKFAFVRNPWDKAVSEYHWYLRYGRFMEFKEWIRTLENRLSITNNLHYLEIGHNVPQYKFIYDDNMKLLVNFVGRFERLNDDFKHICDTIGVSDSTLPHVQTTTSAHRKNYSTYYDEETKDIITNIYKVDIELFNYDFQETF